MVWDAMKPVLWGKIIAITVAYRKPKKKYKEELLKYIDLLECQHKQTCNNKVYQKLLAERKKLEALETSEIQRNILFPCQRYCFKTPGPLHLLKWNVKKSSLTHQIHAIRDCNGQKVTLMPEILSTFRGYYGSLLGSSTPDLHKIQDFLCT